MCGTMSWRLSCSHCRLRLIFLILVLVYCSINQGLVFLPFSVIPSVLLSCACVLTHVPDQLGCSET